MLKEKEKKVVSEEIAKPKKVVESKKFLVLKEFTLDKFYRIGNTIELNNQETIQRLLTTKYIK